VGKTYRRNQLAGTSTGNLESVRRLEKAKKKKADFRCRHCKTIVPGVAPGSAHRNHCPQCLWSRHVDDGVGNRLGAIKCGHGMRPVAVRVRADGEVQILHQCVNDRCRKQSWNRLAADDVLYVVEALPLHRDTTADQRHVALYGKKNRGGT